jgi:hypothetical protein
MANEPSTWRRDTVTERAFASLLEIKIICTPPPPLSCFVQPSKVGRVLASDPGLQPVVAKARQINALAKLCGDFLPPELARLVQAVNLKDRQLVLSAASPAAAAKLKLLAETLRRTLLQQGAEVNSVSVRVQPGPAAPADAPARQPPRLSRRALDALLELHSRLPESPARQALKTLLDHQLNREPGATGRPPRQEPPARK